MDKRHLWTTVIVAALTGLSACGGGETKVETPTAETAKVAAVTLDSVIADARRDKDKARDQYRHPKETLEFFEVGPGKTVAEIWPGWYTDILAPYLAKNGGTYHAIIVPDSLSERRAERNQAFRDKYSDTEIFGTVEYGGFFKDSGPIAEPESLDIVLSFRNVHNWMGRGFADQAFAEFYAALKPGGILGIVEHRLPESSVQDPQGSTGYVQESYMKDMAKRAGFEFVESSEINANPADDADHPFGVWTLRPRSRLPEEGSAEAEGFDPAAYKAIGESDRATLKFRKPAG